MNQDMIEYIVLYLHQFSDLLNVLSCSRSTSNLFSRNILKRHLDKVRLKHHLNDSLVPVAEEWKKRKRDPSRHIRYIPRGYPLSFIDMSNSQGYAQALFENRDEKPWVGVRTITGDRYFVEDNNRIVSCSQQADLLHSFTFGEDHNQIYIRLGRQYLMTIKDVKKGIRYRFNEEEEHCFFPVGLLGWYNLYFETPVDTCEKLTIQMYMIVIKSMNDRSICMNIVNNHLTHVLK